MPSRKELEATDAKIAKLLAALKTFRDAATEIAGVADHISAAILEMDCERHAKVTLALDETDEALKTAKSAIHSGRTFNDKWFCARIAQETGTSKFGTEDHTFSISQKSFPSAPSQTRDPVAFRALLDWLRENGEGDRIEVLEDGRYSLDRPPPEGSKKPDHDGNMVDRPKDFHGYIKFRLEDGLRLPPGVTAHMVDEVRIRKRKSAQTTVDDLK